MIRSLLYKLGGLVQRHPISWAIAWWIVNRVRILPPHDRTYFAFRHFCLKDDGLFLDIGANSGISALSFRKINGSYKILSIEPSFIHRRTLERLKRTLPRFDYLPVAAGAEPGELVLTTPTYRKITLHTFSALSEEEVMSNIRRCFGDRVARETELNRQSVEIKTIDALNLLPDIVKIDVEGFELSVLAGARETIRRARPFMMLETCEEKFDDLISWLNQENFDAFDYLPSEDRFIPINSKLNLTDKNIFAIPREKLQLLAIP